jgi:hypothetical protein
MIPCVILSNFAVYNFFLSSAVVDLYHKIYTVDSFVKQNQCAILLKRDVCKYSLTLVVDCERTE